MKKNLLFLLAFLFVGSLGEIRAEEVPFAIDERMEAVVSTVKKEEIIEVMDREQTYQELELLIVGGSKKGEKIEIISGDIPLADLRVFEEGDKVVVSRQKGLDGEEIFNIIDFDRRGSLVLLAGIFLILTVVITRWKGVSSLISMGLTFVVIIRWILPRIANGSDPVTVAIIGSMMIIPLTFYLSHGLNKKTTIAIGSTIITLIATGVLAKVFMELAHLSGLSSEDAAVLYAMNPGMLSMKGLLLAGIVIGSLGILDDITIAQSAIVEEIRNANGRVGWVKLYKSAMNVGRDHIASMVNTLILVYAGASLPILLLFLDNSRPIGELVNYEFIAEEIVRTLTGSIGLILAVPITTIIAAKVALKDRPEDKTESKIKER